MEINFYCISNDINRFLYQFLLQLVEKEKRVIIYSESEEKVKALDDTLWRLGHNKFLPHGIKKDGYIEHHPLYLTNEKENPNNAEFLLISNYLDDTEYMQKFGKIFYVFTDTNIKSFENAKKNWNAYKDNNFALKCLKKGESGKWEEKGEWF